jgi:hypothetical protein
MKKVSTGSLINCWNKIEPLLKEDNMIWTPQMDHHTIQHPIKIYYTASKYDSLSRKEEE